ncbi:MAG: hypothetical protein ACRDQI_03040 [Pseudonocardiaceae bacterium]
MTSCKTRLPIIAAAAAIAATLTTAFPAAAGAQDHDRQSTATLIEHLVVIFQENVSFDHYFATYRTRPTLLAKPQVSFLKAAKFQDGHAGYSRSAR